MSWISDFCWIVSASKVYGLAGLTFWKAKLWSLGNVRRMA